MDRFSESEASDDDEPSDSDGSGSSTSSSYGSSQSSRTSNFKVQWFLQGNLSRKYKEILGFSAKHIHPTAFVSSLLRHSGVPRSVASNPWGWSRPACEVQEEFQGD